MSKSESRPMSVIFHLENSHVVSIHHSTNNECFTAVVEMEVPIELIEDFCLKLKEQIRNK